MPKITIPPLPLSGLFGIVKPSGPTSMSVLTDIKKLAGKSRLFVEADKLGKPDHSRKNSKKRSRFDSVKIGQGGTLDPLANGVLGMSRQIMLIAWTTPTAYFSRWRRKGNQASCSIFRLH